jgi:peptidoglycan/LPS O-acetylase OafA/YrhL
VARHIPVLDSIRGVAIIMVMIAHFFQGAEASIISDYPLFGPVFLKIAYIGLSGVDLFFILSGFLITGILIETKNSRNYFRVFYIRRFLRIFPLYYLVLFISFFIFIKIYPDPSFREVERNQIFLWSYLSNLASTVNNIDWNAGKYIAFGHFWSLCVEEHFYMIWPAIVFIFSLQNLKKIIITIFIISFFSFIYSSITDHSFWLFKWSTIKYSGALVAGGFISIIYKDGDVFQKTINIAKRIFPTLIILLLLFSLIPRRFGLSELFFLYSWVPYLFLLILALAEHKQTFKLLNNKFFAGFGKISYGLYIYHGLFIPVFNNYYRPIVDNLINNSLLAAIVFVITCSSICYGISWLSWRFFESKILMLKRNFQYV